MNKVIFLLTISLFLFGAPNAQVISFEIDSSKFNKDIKHSLEEIHKKDQSTRFKLIHLIKANATASAIDSAKAVLLQSDNENIEKVNSIIDQYGWLGPQDVGFTASQGLFLVIQHADLATQKKYLPIVQQAEKDRKILSSNLALLEDRIAMREGRKQLYGSQRFTDKSTGKNYIYPIFNPDELDNRRKSMGLPPMKDYVQTWDLQKYKEELPQIEIIAKEQNIH